jgi:hypothetical protein
MSSDKIPGVPDGWELVHANRAAMPGEYFIDRVGNVVHWGAEEESAAVYPIIRKIEKPAAYRPFANAEEFKPHRDRWWRYNDSEDSEHVQPPAAYSKIGPMGSNWEQAFSGRVFDDGTPFGVRIDE